MKNLIFAAIAICVPLLSQAQVGSRLKNNSAVKSFEAGEFKEGEEQINRALEGDASNAVILYNWAAANLTSVLVEVAAEKQKKLNEEQIKRVQSANQELEKLLKSNTRASKSLRKEILYQNALSLSLLEKNSEALAGFYLSLNEESPRLSDEESKILNEKTQTNIAHLLIKSQSSSSGKGDGGGEGENEDQDSSGENDGESEGQDGDQQKSRGQGQRREPEFSGTDVNESQAQQILNSVSNQDRQVQQRKGQQQSKQNMQGEHGEALSPENHKPW
jgi:hypothetical protein